MAPRGVLNHNPGNLDKGQPWQGLAKPEDMTPEQRAEPRFAVFSAPEWGIRAMVRVLQTYRKRYGINTVEGIIGRWAPPSENNTGAYVNAVAKSLGVAPDDPIDTADPEILRPLIKAIIQHENGLQPYGDATIMAGIALAGLGGEVADYVPKERESVVKSTTIQASGSSLVAITGAVVTAITQIEGTAQLVVIGFLGVAALATLWIMRERLRKWSAGDR